MNIKRNNEYLLCEQNWVYYTLIMVSGFWGAFTYLLRGNVFCNAQTGNVVLLGLAIGSGKVRQAIYYLIPISAYLAGAFLSEILPNPIKHSMQIRWDTLLIGVEILAVVILGFIPESFPVQISQVAINFIASMQFNTFRQAQGTPMATTFATNHIRQIGIGLAKEIQHWDKADKSHRIKLEKHFSMKYETEKAGILQLRKVKLDRAYKCKYNIPVPLMVYGGETMRQCMDAENLHRRLAKILGQIQAVDRMVDEDVPCEDILSQINAAKSALHKCGQVVLEGHIKHCVRDGIEHGDADKTIASFTKAVERFANMK